MAEIVNFYRQSLPAMKFVGKKYGEEDQRGGTFSETWCEWFRNDLFAPLAALGGAKLYENGDAYIGLSLCPKDGPFAYWIGMFAPLDAPIPAGYDSVLMDACDVAVSWVRGKEPDIYSFCCLSRLKEEGLAWAADENGVRWCFERYVCPRFTEPDAEGNVTLDMCFRV